MVPHSSGEVTRLLRAWTNGEREALEKLTPLVYEQLHHVAQCCMAGERTDHTLQTTALVNEVYLRLVDCRAMNWQDRAHFFAVSAQLTRRMLIDFARSRGYQKRGVLRVSGQTVVRDWRLAKVWLLRELSAESNGGE